METINKLIRYAVIEDNAAFAQQLISYLNQCPRLSFAGVAHTKKEGIILAQAQDIDVFLLDIALDESDSDGVDILKVIQDNSNAKALILSSFDDEIHLAETAIFGAADYISKDEYYRLEEKIIKVLEEKITWIIEEKQSITGKFMRMLANTHREKMLGKLSREERRIFNLRLEGHTLVEISIILGKNQSTVKNQNHSMLAVFDCRSFEELTDKLGYVKKLRCLRFGDNEGNAL
jgi:DNA-binding NarL/FixJ family response regulator